MPYLPIKDIEFIGKKRKACDVSGGAHHRSKSKGKDISSPTADEEKKFLDSLVSCSGAKPIVLSVLPTYCTTFIPSCLDSDLPFLLNDLFKPAFLKLSFYELLEEAEKTTLPAISEKQWKMAEMMTRDRSLIKRGTERNGKS